MYCVGGGGVFSNVRRRYSHFRFRAIQTLNRTSSNDALPEPTAAPGPALAGAKPATIARYQLD